MNGAPDDTFLQNVVHDAIQRWRGGELPDAAALLTRHPALSSHKNLAIDLIYEEYCLRNEQGATLVPSTFCERFPHYRQSLSKMLEVHHALEEDPNLNGKTSSSPWPLVGDSFMGFQLIEALGRGSLARVFLARESAVGSRVVVVKISRHGANEAQMLGKAAHPAIVPILSVTHDDSTGWTVICMPLLGTATATDLLQAAFSVGRSPATADVVARVARQFHPVGVPQQCIPPNDLRMWRTPYADGIASFGLLLAEGLQAAHEAGVMHRDIKPSNVLLAWSGRPMLLDFNLSTDAGLLSKRVGGTLAYMAPEQIAALAADRGASARQFDPRADLYSLGALLYELLTGRLPCKPENAEQLPPDDFAPWLAVRRQPIIPPRQLDPRIDPGLESIVLRCLATEPAQRQASALDLVGELRRYLGWAPSATRQLRRHRRQAMIGALTLTVLAVAGGIYASRLPSAEERQYEQGLRQFDRGQYDAAEKSFGQCLELRPEWPEAHFARGQTLRQTGDFGAARSEFLALKNHDVALAYSLAGYCDIRLNNFPAAEADYEFAIKSGENDAITWTNFGYCDMRQGLYQRAIERFDKALALNPNIAIARHQRALARYNQSLGEGTPPTNLALEDSRAACRLEPDRADFHFYAATIFALAMQEDKVHKVEALEYLQRALKLGYPPKAVLGSGGTFTILLQEIPPELLAEVPPDSQPPMPSPLYVDPVVTAELGDFSTH